MMVQVANDHVLCIDEDNSPLGYCMLLKYVNKLKEALEPGKIIFHDIKDLTIRFNGPIRK